MAFTATILAVAAGVGAGVDELVRGLSGSSKGASGPEKAALPDPTKASAAASATVADQRAALLASGGITDYTGGMGVLTGSDVSKTTLIGG